MKIFLPIYFLFIISHLSAQDAIKSDFYADAYLNDRFYFCWKPQFTPQSDNFKKIETQFNELLSVFEIQDIKQAFPEAVKPTQQQTRQGEKLADLSPIYIAHINPPKDIHALCIAFLKTGWFEYTEPHFLPELTYIPSDDSASSQYALYRIHAFEAWDIHKGDTTMLIGVTDTGIDPLHPDLIDNIHTNYADPINGIDDDNDGYVDNFRGWDTGDSDNDPSADLNYHGQHVSGLCSATTDNNLGVAGSGFKCRLVPIKISDANGLLTGAYAGVVYAANFGCKVINCSWGGFQFSRVNEAVIRYAAVNMDCIVFCGAGNNNNERLFYPASYPYAVSVASTNELDHKSNFSTYGYAIDICAPGDLVNSTWIGDTYLKTGGTSMASPIAAGCAGILRSALPNWNSRQIARQLITNADPIDTIPFNTEFENKLGNGRVNLFRALSNSTARSMRLIEYRFYDNRSNLFLPGDTLFLDGNLINYLSPVNAANLTIEVAEGGLQTLENQRVLGSLETLQSIEITPNPLKFLISDEAGKRGLAVIKLSFELDGIVDNQYIPIELNADFIHLEENLIQTSIGSDSRIAISGNGMIQGLGFRYIESDNLMFEGGLMVGMPPNVVLSRTRGTSGFSNDFSTVEFIRNRPLAFENTFEIEGFFASNTEFFPLQVKQRYLASSEVNNLNFIIADYTLSNLSNWQVFQGLYAGIFSDWDIEDPYQNLGFSNLSNRYSAVHSASNDSLFVGIGSLGELPFNLHIIENSPGGNGGLDLSDGFSPDEKFISLSLPRLVSGDNEPKDIISVVSSGPHSISPGESIQVGFVLFACSDSSQISEIIAAASDFYNQIVIPLHQNDENLSVLEIFPNPASTKINIKGLHSKAKFYLSDLRGKEMQLNDYKNTTSSISIEHLSPGYYFLTIIQDKNISTHKILIHHR